MRLIVVSLSTLLAASAAAAPLDLYDLEPRESLDPASLPQVDLRFVDELYPHGETVPLPGFEGGQTDPQAIVNGTIVGTYDYPNVVALAGFDNWGGFVFCSGSLIDHEWVLTAAHCLTDAPSLLASGLDLYVLFGSDLLGVGIVDMIEWQNHYQHPSYNEAQFLNDIGLVKLVDPKNGVDLVVLNDEPVTQAWYGDDLTILGFGITTDGAQNAGVKRITDVPVVDHDSQYVYTYDPATNVCQGDSGGPAFESTVDGLEQVGVNAFVTPGCVGGAAGLTRVDMHIPWIQGYVPNVLLSGSGAGSGGEPEPEETDPNSGGGGGGGGGDLDLNQEIDQDAIDRDLGDPARPGKGTYPLGMRCSAVGGGAAGGWLAVPLLLLLRRRRG